MGAHGAGKIVPLERARLEEAGGVLARAFADDPAWRWILPGDRRRRRTLPWLFRAAVAVTLAGGRVDTTAGEVRGLALWIPAGDGLVSVDHAAARTMLALPLRLRSAFRRFRAYTEWNFALQRRAQLGPALFLSGLGVDPAHQRRGIGGALLEAGLEREPHTPAVLLTNNEWNIRFYERHGFGVVDELTIPGGGPRTWAMVRPPQ
ncbi:MAG TPA: GNAT family N-acetyltransferase [Gaiellaceae bacterium]|nr:GNAT family N-acetyltransferase [Gaiellaceae bacterium]